MNLRTKWMLWTLIFVISFSIILVSFFIENGKKNLELELEKWGTSLATNLAYSAQYAALVKDHETLQNYLIGIMNEKEILYAAVLDDSGAILAIVDPKWKFTTSIHDLSMKAPDGKIDRFDSPEEGGYCNIVKFMEIEKEELIEDERILF
ncbi:hypothetical protein JXJ21_13100, partial [candidate division KSB1 bacterium]|nr:hypothetical protein [candidate division KSB1 bacterium]